MSHANEHASGGRDQGIYLDFSSNSGENEEKPSSSGGVGQVNESFGKMAPISKLAVVIYSKLKEMERNLLFKPFRVVVVWTRDIRLQSLQSDLLIFE